MPVPAVRRCAIRPWMVASGLCALYLGLILFRHGSPFDAAWPTLAGKPLSLGILTVRMRGGANEFIWPGATRQEGYDGQFTYAIALDLANVAPRLDVPGYRYQRILQPVLVRLLSLGHEPLIPWLIVLTDLAALAAGTAALDRLLIAERVNRWYALVYGLFGGIFFAVRVGTSEPLAYGLVLLAILAGQRGRLTWQAILLALAALTKETTLFFVAGYALYSILERRWRDVVRFGVIAAAPFAVWQIVLAIWLGKPGIGSGGAMATPFEIVPFNGIWRLAGYGLTVFFVVGLLPILFAMLPTLWALWRGVTDTIRRRWHPYVFLMLANAAIMPFVPFSTYREPLAVARFLPGLVTGVLLYAALRKSRRALTYSTLWVLLGLVLLG
jgi:hypothetical protein